MNKKLIIPIIIMCILAASAFAWSTSNTGNLNVRGYFNQSNSSEDFIVNDDNAQFVGNVTATYYLGDGSLLTGINFSDSNWNITGSNYLIDNSDILDINETKLNATYLLSGNEGDLNVNSSNSTTFWSSVSSFIARWFYDNGNVLTFNETLLNDTIDARDADTTYTADETYINLVGTTFTQNETTLNATIDARDTDTDTKWNITGSEYVYNNSNILSVNETKLNNTIETIGNATYILQTEEGNLNVNSSDYVNWSGILNKFITAVDYLYIYMSGTTATLNETKLNNTIETIGNVTYILLTSEGDLNVNSTTYWASVSSFLARWFYDNSNVLTFNETLLNATIDARSDFDTDTNWNITGSNYLINNSDILDLNETKLNVTIDARDSDTTYTADETYINLIGTTFTQNETKLNATIEALDNDTKYTATNPVLITGTVISSNTSYFDSNYYNQTLAISTFVNRSKWTTIDNYPSDCGASNYVYGLGDTLSCRADVDTTYTADETYINLISTTFTQNETKLNATIDARDADTTYSADEDYINLVGTTFTQNETTLNATIDSSISDSTINYSQIDNTTFPFACPADTYITQLTNESSVCTGVSDVYLKNDADDSTTGRLTAAGFTSSANIYLGNGNAIRNQNNGASTMYFDVSSGGASHGAFSFRSSSAYTSRLYISPGGSVGIGTTTPARKLSISSATDGEGILTQTVSSTAGLYTGNYFKVSAGVVDTFIKAGILFERTGSYGVGKLHLAVNNDADSSNVDLDDVKLTIDEDGDVGIGTTAPAKTLDVNGSIIAESYFSNQSNEGITETFVCLNGEVEAKTLTFENGILVDYT